MSNAFVPVYVSSAAIKQINIEAPKPVSKAGKIYVYGTYLFENDVNTGIHIIDCSDRSHPKKVSFISIPICTEVAVKGNYLYTNNFTDLLTFDISNPASPTLVKRIADFFPLTNQTFPPYTNVAFECADASKGVVVSWEQKNIKTPICRR